MAALPAYVLIYSLLAFSAFWIVRLAVRFGVDDALRKNAGWIAPGRSGGTADSTQIRGKSTP